MKYAWKLAASFATSVTLIAVTTLGLGWGIASPGGINGVPTHVAPVAYQPMACSEEPASATTTPLPTALSFASAVMPPNTPQGTPPPTLATPPVVKMRRLTSISSTDFEHRLLDRLGQRFVPVKQLATDTNTAVYRMPVRNGTSVEIRIDRQTNVITVVGTPAAANAIVRLTEMLDMPADANTRTEIVPFRADAYRTVAQVTDLLDNEVRENTATTTPSTGTSGETRRGNSIAERRATPNNENTAVATAIRRATAEGLIGPVQIEMLDGLDTIVLRGNKNDVQVVLDMVRQIETMNIETEPNITIYRMRETDCTRVTQIVVRLYNEIYLSRRGSVTFLALVKPNAILLVGQEGAVQTAIDLIRKLDKPVAPESEFVVIRLQHAAAATLKTQIDEFYADRGVLSTMVRVTSDFRSNSLIVQGSPRDLAEVAEFVRKIDIPGGETTNQMRVIPLKNAVASELATTLTNIISSTGTAAQTAPNAVLEMMALDTQSGTAMRSGVLNAVRVTADTRSNSILVSAPAATMPLVETLILQLDRLPAAESQVKLFTIINGDASSLSTMLQTIFQASTTGTGTTGQSSNIATVRSGTTADESTLVGVRFAVDTRTNTIVASGSASDMSLVEAILFRLDEDNLQNRQVIVFRLLNSPAADIATALNSYLTSERQLELQSTGTFYPQSALEQYRKEVVVVAEPISNNLIVSTTPRYYEQIKKIVAQLDERPPKVVIQVILAQVSLSNDREFGMELGLQDSILFDRSTVGTGTAAGTTIPGFNFLGNPLGNNTARNASDPSVVGTQGVSSLGVGRGNGFSFTASSESLSIFIRALEEHRKVQILSRPQMTTVDNKRASMSSGETLRMVTSVSQNATGTVSGTEEAEAGLILDVTPRITPDGLVVMDIYAERSHFGPESEGTVVGVSGGQEMRVPRKEMVKAQTTISALSGQTVIMGGLIAENKATVTRSVPVLNKIPVVRSFFEYKSTTCDRSELLIIMTPTVIRNECDMEIVKQQELARMHWCISDVIRAGGEAAWRQRSDDWALDETNVIWMSEPFVPGEKDLPSTDTVRSKRILKAPLPAFPEN